MNIEEIVKALEAEAKARFKTMNTPREAGIHEGIQLAQTIVESYMPDWKDTNAQH